MHQSISLTTLMLKDRVIAANHWPILHRPASAHVITI